MIYKTPEEAVNLIQSNQTVFVHGGAATPTVLLKALVERASELRNVELVHLHTEGYTEYAKPEYRGSFRVSNLFVGAGMRPWLDYDSVDYLPIFLSEIPRLFRSGKKKIDVALVQVSPPDEHGLCSLGTSVDCARAAVETATVVLAQVNPQMPRVHGDGFIELDKINALCEADLPIYNPKPCALDADDRKIGEHVASLIEDGDTLQVGIGSVPDAALRALVNHKHMGVHTEMWSDGILDLIEAGVVDNSRKKLHAGKTVSTFLMGSRKVYDYVHDNPKAVLLEADYVNNPINILRNPGVAAINSAVEIDLTGQVCADSIGSRIISGVGGQMDFMRGAALSERGKPILALKSRSAKGMPRIVPTLKLGSGVVTTRAHMRFVVTEYGIVDLFGKTLRERAGALISIAHPDDRDNLLRSWYEIHKKHSST